MTGALPPPLLLVETLGWDDLFLSPKIRWLRLRTVWNMLFSCICTYARRLGDGRFVAVMTVVVATVAADIIVVVVGVDVAVAFAIATIALAFARVSGPK